MKDILIEIDRIVADELERANKVHPLFHSDHEGIAVIHEEMVEVRESFITSQMFEGQAWEDIMKDDSDDAAGSIKEARMQLAFTAAELIHVIAMCDKFIASQEARDGNSGENR